MRITIDSDDKGKVKINTGDRVDLVPGVFEPTTDVQVIDAGPAPIQEIERMQKLAAAGEVSGLSATPAAASPEEREKDQPLNPLRAGAAAAYRDPANLRMRAAESEGTFAAQQQQQQQQLSAGTGTSDGGAAPVPEGKEASAAQTSERQSSKRAKRDKKR